MTRAGAALRCTAPGKVNLYLHVTGRRPDGYHTLESLVVFTRLGDVVAVKPASTLRLSVTGPFASAIADVDPAENLAMRAATALARRFSVRTGADIALRKNLPVAAGIGGGSSDAAATLRLLDRLWCLDAPPVVLSGIAADIGADVPVCLAGRPSLVAGIGETCRPLAALPAWWLVLANPGRPLPTAAVFARFDLEAMRGTRGVSGRGDVALDRIRRAANDLDGSARLLVPEIDSLISALAGSRGCHLARLSGSGPTCFGVFDDRRDAARAARGLATAHPAWWVRATSLRRARPRLEAM
jgi:4-diphosphocytidyl-2-C-methyl-D-erythritol kinase